MSKGIMPVPHDHIRSAGHGGVNRILSQHGAENRIRPTGRHAADGVRGIKILQIDFDLAFFKVGIDPVFQQKPDILVENITGRILILFLIREKILPGTFRYNDHRMMAFIQAFFQVLQQAARTIQFERIFRNKETPGTVMSKARPVICSLVPAGATV